MKGVVFTEFVEFVEESFGFDSLDEMIAESGLSGVYTQAGNYPFDEMVTLLGALSKQQNSSIEELLEAYGTHLFKRLASLYPNLEKFHSAFDVVEHVDSIIHPEVHKLYPEAELPSFKTIEKTDKKIVLHYFSDKSLEYLAKGLIVGAGKHYQEVLHVKVTKLSNAVEIEVRKD